MLQKGIIILLVLISSLSVKAHTLMNDDDHQEEQEHETKNHNHHRNEIGIANAPVYFVKEKSFNYGLHLHYIYNFPNTIFGLGFGYERIFDEHKHNTIGLVACVRPFEPWSINFSPGIAMEGADNFKPMFAFHLETTYEFEIKNFHIGPVAEFAYDKEDIHLSLGLHIGFGFTRKKNLHKHEE
ncbi:MAG: hypothetical protein H6553_04170 [Chitinophagales bacterium]|nr:hypothetical protein [Chitinophagales bacterium]